MRTEEIMRFPSSSSSFSSSYIYTSSDPAAGASEDWGYGRLGAKYTYVVELRDEGRFGFLLPENQILPTGIETFAGIKELGRNIVTEYIV